MLQHSNAASHLLVSVAQSFLGLLALGDVRIRARDANCPAARVALRNLTLAADPDPGAGGSPHAVLGIVERRISLEQTHYRSVYSGKIIGVNLPRQQIHGGPGGFGSLAKYFRPAFAQEHLPGADIPLEKRQLRTDQREAKLLLRTQDFRFLVLAFGQVVPHRQHHRFAAEGDRSQGYLDGEFGTVQTPVKPFEPVVAPLPCDCVHLHRLLRRGPAIRLRFRRKHGGMQPQDLLSVRAADHGERGVVAVDDAVLVEQQVRVR